MAKKQHTPQHDQPAASDAITLAKDDSTARRLRFIEAYLSCWVGAEAARRAGYKSPEVAASRLLRNDKVREAIRKRLDEMKAEADMVIAQLRAIATASIGNYVRHTPVYRTHTRRKTAADPNDTPELIEETTADIIGVRTEWDFLNPAADMSMVRKITIKPTKYGDHITLELHNKLEALTTLARIHGLMASTKDDDWQQYIIQLNLNPNMIAAAMQKLIELAAMMKAGQLDKTERDEAFTQFVELIENAASDASTSA